MAINQIKNLSSAIYRSSAQQLPLKNYVRIMVAGPGGSGKSVFANHLGRYLGIKVSHIDQAMFNGNILRAQNDILKDVLSITAQDSWVLDGSLPWKTNEQLTVRAQLIIILLPNRITCFFRICRRILKYRHHSRPSQSEGHVEKLTWRYIRFMLLRRSWGKEYLSLYNNHPDQAILLRSSHAANQWLQQNGYPPVKKPYVE